MKKYIAVVLSVLALSFSAKAQTNEGSFLSSFGSYFSSFNTNLTAFSSNQLDVDVGMDYVSGVNISSSLGLEYIFDHMNNGLELSAESVTRNAGIAGIIVSQQAGIGLSKVIYDTKMTVYADGGYSWANKQTYVELGLRLKKQLTTHTFAGIGLSIPIENGTRSLQPVFSVFTGFTL